MENAEIPWAHVFGNHDDNYGVPNAEAETVYESFPHCVSQAGPEDVDGTGNYVLPVYDGDTVRFNLFALDSHSGMSEFRRDYALPEDTKFLSPRSGAASGYDTVHFNQIMWYWQTSCAMEKENGAKIPALMFMHIPLPEHALAAMYRDECRFEGTQLEDVACTSLNSGLFSACLQRGDVKGIFCGHDHVNDFTATYCGIMLGYDGFLSYHACHRNEIRGGRIFDLRTDGSFITKMIRIRDILGTKGDSVP
ncbi:MAG: metallophosphoesterase [Clostridia bacterium]|nr:metallophosphoesterase [Clostridia bacterium]